MRLIFIKIVLLLVCCLTIVGEGCIRVDNPPQLSITVLDADEQPVSGAVVGLFDTWEAWSNREYPVQVWKATDVSGEVIFTDLKEQLYYIYVRKDLADNSGDMISTSNQLTVNHRLKVVIHIY